MMRGVAWEVRESWPPRFHRMLTRRAHQERSTLSLCTLCRLRLFQSSQALRPRRPPAPQQCAFLFWSSSTRTRSPSKPAAGQLSEERGARAGRIATPGTDIQGSHGRASSSPSGMRRPVGLLGPTLSLWQPTAAPRSPVSDAWTGPESKAWFSSTSRHEVTWGNRKRFDPGASPAIPSGQAAPQAPAQTPPTPARPYPPRAGQPANAPPERRNHPNFYANSGRRPFMGMRPIPPPPPLQQPPPPSRTPLPPRTPPPQASALPPRSSPQSFRVLSFRTANGQNTSTQRPEDASVPRPPPRVFRPFVPSTRGDRDWSPRPATQSTPPATSEWGSLTRRPRPADELPHRGPPPPTDPIEPGDFWSQARSRLPPAPSLAARQAEGLGASVPTQDSAWAELKSEPELPNVEQRTQPGRSMVQDPETEEHMEGKRKKLKAKDRRKKDMSEDSPQELVEGDGDKLEITDRRELKKRTKGKIRKNNQDEDEDEAPKVLTRDEKRRLKEERERQKEKEAAEAAAAAAAEKVRAIFLPQYINVGNLAVAMGVKEAEFLVALGDMGFKKVTRDSIMTGETAGLVAQDYGFEPTIDLGEERDLKPRPPHENPTELPPRPPIVTIMGHVDHGKTTLLDYLRKSSIVAQEHGGITQHIGAFSVSLPSLDRQITFLDTPGHEAFLSMRQRGANVTDLVVLVVAAEDSVMPQTVEAINHAKGAKVPIIVAINKMDMIEESRREPVVERVKADLGRHGVEVEDYGGDVPVVLVSGKRGDGMQDLEELIVTLAEVLDMRAETDGPAEGWVLESSIKSDVGRSATVLIKRGTLRTGDIVVAGCVHARVRLMRNEAGATVGEVPPGMPAEVFGWDELPEAGDMLLQADSEARARDAADYRLELIERGRAMAEIAAREDERQRAAEEAARKKAEASDEEEAAESRPWFDKQRLRDVRRGIWEQGRGVTDSAAAMAANAAAEAEARARGEAGPVGTKTANFIVRGDVHGSVEAVADSIMEIGNDEVRPRVLHQAAGMMTESDVELAVLSGATIINFNNLVAGHIRALADAARVRVLDGNVIYKVTDDVKTIMTEMLPPRVSKRVVAEAEVLQLFKISGGKKKVAGCRVMNGRVEKKGRVRVMRGRNEVYDGTISELKHGRDEATRIDKGGECGIALKDWEDFKEGDQVQVYEEIEEKRYL